MLITKSNFFITMKSPASLDCYHPFLCRSLRWFSCQSSPNEFFDHEARESITKCAITKREEVGHMPHIKVEKVNFGYKNNLETDPKWAQLGYTLSK